MADQTIHVLAKQLLIRMIVYKDVRVLEACIEVRLELHDRLLRTGIFFARNEDDDSGTSAVCFIKPWLSRVEVRVHFYRLVGVDDLSVRQRLRLSVTSPLRPSYVWSRISIELVDISYQQKEVEKHYCPHS